MRRVIWLLRYARDKHGAMISFERPAGATSWQQVPELQALRAECYESVTHGCMWGLRNLFTGSLVTKSCWFISSDSGLVNRITRRCNHTERHEPIEGRMTALSSEYPIALCKAFARAVMRPPKRDYPTKLMDEYLAVAELPMTGCVFSNWNHFSPHSIAQIHGSMAYPVSHEDSVPNAVPVTRLTEAERPEYVPVEADHQQVDVIDRAIVKLHKNLGLLGTRLSKASSSTRGSRLDHRSSRRLQM